MELEAYNGKRSVPEAHDCAVVGMRRDFEAIGKRAGLNDE